MSKTKIFLIALLTLGLLNGCFLRPALAQEETTAQEEATPTSLSAEETPAEQIPKARETIPSAETAAKAAEMIKADEEISAEDLGVKEPIILPDNLLYPIKNIWRGFKKAVTFNPVKKAGLELQSADEKMVEANKLAEKNGKKLEEAKNTIEQNEKIIEEAKISEKSDEEIKKIIEAAENQKEEAEKNIGKISRRLEKTLDSFAKDIEKIEKRGGQLKKELKDSPILDNFIDKFTDHQFKQQRLLDKIEKDIPQGKILEKTEEAKEKVLKNFGQALTNLMPAKEVSEKITQIIERQKGSDFKHFKNLEVLKELEEKVPEQAKEAIRQAKDNAFKRMGETMETIPREQRGLFKEYIKNISGNESRQLKVIDGFSGQEMPEFIRNEMEKAKETAFDRIQERMEQLKSDSRKEAFFKHLETGQMEDLRLIKELENNLPPQTIDKIIEIKNKTKIKLKEEFEKTGQPEIREKFFNEIERSHDVRQLAVLKEMEEIIPEDKKEFFGQMKDKAMAEMNREIEAAGDTQKRAMIVDKLAGDSPEHIQVLKEFGRPTEIMTEIMKKQTEKLGQLIENIQDAERLELFKGKIEEEEIVKEELKSQRPDIFRKIEGKEKFFFERMEPKNTSSQLQKAQEEILLAEKEFGALDESVKNRILEKSSFEVLLNLANKRLDQAQEGLDSQSSGQVFGQTTSALHQASNARRIIKEISIRQETPEMKKTKMEEKFFEKETQKREKLEEKFEKEFQGEKMTRPGQFQEQMAPRLPQFLKESVEKRFEGEFKQEEKPSKKRSPFERLEKIMPFERKEKRVPEEFEKKESENKGEFFEPKEKKEFQPEIPREERKEQPFSPQEPIREPISQPGQKEEFQPPSPSSLEQPILEKNPEPAPTLEKARVESVPAPALTPSFESAPLPAPQAPAPTPQGGGVFRIFERLFR